MSSSIDIVVAIDLNNGIGFKNELIYKNCKIDMNRFKRVTEGNFALLARKTYESLSKPLKGRVNVILTRDTDYSIDPHLHKDYKILVEHDLNKIINHYRSGENERNLVCCGGSELYKQMLPYTDRVFLTLFHDDSKEADTYFPLDYVNEHFEILHKEEHEDENGLRFDFIDYVRKENIDGEKEDYLQTL